MAIDRLLEKLKRYIIPSIEITFYDDPSRLDSFFSEIKQDGGREIRLFHKVRYSKWKKYFSKRFKEKNVSVEEYSRETGISTITIHSYLKGEYFPTSSSVKKRICESFNINEKYLNSLED